MVIFINALVILLIVVLSAIWAGRGFFSALLHLGVTIVAGTLAFAFWEPLALLMINSAPANQTVLDIAWGVALVVPFALGVAIIAAIVNATVRGNLRVSAVPNFVGGAICGGALSTLTMGIIAIGVSNMRVAETFGFMPLAYSQDSIVRSGGLWLPADRAAAWFFSFASDRALRSSTSLANAYPDLSTRGHLHRVGPNDDSAVVFRRLAPDAFEFLSRYRVEGQAAEILKGRGVENGFVYNEGAVSPASVKGIDDQPIATGNVAIEGFVIRPTPGAREDKVNAVLHWAGSATLVLEQPSTGAVISRQPVAVISELVTPENQLGPYGLNLFRGLRAMFGSLGAGDPKPAAYEFIVPNDKADPWVPTVLYVRGSRFDLRTKAPQPTKTFASGRARLDALNAGTLVTNNAVGGVLVEAGAQSVDSKPFSEGGLGGPISASINLGQFQVVRGGEGGLQLDERRITGGEARIRRDDLAGRGNTDRNLIVNEFQPPSAGGIEQVMIQVNASQGSKFWLAEPAWAQFIEKGAPQLVGVDGTRYACVGWIFEDSSQVWIRFTPARPVTRASDLGQVNPFRDETRKLRLLFLVNQGAQIDRYAIGDQVVLKFDPPLLFNQSQTRRR
jgi:hypothetical protein